MPPSLAHVPPHAPTLFRDKGAHQGGVGAPHLRGTEETRGSASAHPWAEAGVSWDAGTLGLGKDH